MTSVPSAPHSPRVPIIPELRWFFLVVLTVAAGFALLLFTVPGRVDLYGPWVIPNPRSAYVVGSAYAAAAVYYAVVLRTNDWAQARGGLGGLVVFSLAVLAATAKICGRSRRS